ncbi:uncharacterized protein [Epargyreus clarus]|uniref:uncharacterized protein n=1 Tax=Epargyreus clarus TaxID=520877 RepID=UPI003C302B58
MVTIYGLLCLCCMLTYGGGVTKTSGIEQFWTDDFKVFDQVYGKTSDKDLYGATLPPTVTFTLDHAKTNIKAAEKTELYSTEDDAVESEQQLYPYAFGDRYAKLFAKNTLKPGKKKSSGLKFVGVDFKPISQSSDPETYNYLKHLEHHQQIQFPEEGIGGFTPYASNSNIKLENTDAYKSIQDILDAHEANKNSNKDNDVDNLKYLRYGTSKGKSKVRLSKGNTNYLTKGPKPRCRNGRCRKRNTSTYRVGARPYLRRIKHRLVNY